LSLTLQIGELATHNFPYGTNLNAGSLKPKGAKVLRDTLFGVCKVPSKYARNFVGSYLGTNNASQKTNGTLCLQKAFYTYIRGLCVGDRNKRHLVLTKGLLFLSFCFQFLLFVG